jgi:predicted GH43/DUF377 family glycosyl hydrolase
MLVAALISAAAAYSIVVVPAASSGSDVSNGQDAPSPMEATGSEVVAATATKKYFLLNKGSAREILDEATIATLGFKVDELETSPWSIVSQFKIGEPIALIKWVDYSADDITRVELLKNRALQEQLILDMFHLGEAQNPSVVKFQGRLLMVTAFAWGQIEGQNADGYVRYKWVNHSSYPFYSKDKYLGIDTKTNFLEGHTPDKLLWGVDPRAVVLNASRVWIAYNDQHFTSVMGVADLVVNSSGLADIVFHCNAVEYAGAPGAVEKNWAPFVYNNTVLYVQKIRPMHVLQSQIEGPGKMHFGGISLSREWKAPWWTWGDFRGGTNAMRVGDVYLAFFHSSTQLPRHFMKTYFFGAYTFTAEPPFRVLGVSQVPIMNWALYTVAWSAFSKRGIDYVTFPTSYFLEGDKIMLSLGHQDKQGWLLTLKVDAVLASLNPVEYS